MTDLFFTLSKVFWTLAQPDHFLLLMLLLGLFLWRSLMGVLLVWCAVIAFLLISFFPVGNYLLRPLENQFPVTKYPDSIAGIIVLGGGEDAELSAIHGSPQFNSGAERLMMVPHLLKRYPEAKVIFTGGSGTLLRPEYRGGDVARQWLTQLGLNERLIVERNSRNTFQNAIYTKEIIDDLDSEEGPWLLVTSAFHIPRSMGVFRQAGIDVIPYPVDFRTGEDRVRPDFTWNMHDFKTALREWIGLWVYHLTDRTPELLPSPDVSQSGT